jgi:hypothetical protein
MGAIALVQGISFTGTAVTPISDDGQVTYVNIKSVNTSLSTGHSALNPAVGSSVIGSELVSQAGNGLNFNADVFAIGNYIHDTPTCIKAASNGEATLILNNIIAGCMTNAINFSTASASHEFVMGNTFYGSERKDGQAISVATSNAGVQTIGNIFYGWATAVGATTANTNAYSNWNTFSNNTTARSNWPTGAQDQTCAPGMTGVTTISGTAGTVSSATLTDNAATMTVTDGQDYLDVISGSGVTTTPSSLPIVSHTTHSVTVATAIGGSGTNISYFIRTGHNFATSPACKRLGYPGLFPAGLTTGYTDIGAVQRREYGRPVNK